MGATFEAERQMQDAVDSPGGKHGSSWVPGADKNLRLVSLEDGNL